MKIEEKTKDMRLASLKMFDPAKLFLRTRLFAILIIITFLIIFAITLLVHYGERRELIDSAVASNRTTVNLLSTIVREHQKAVSGIVQSYASRRMVIAAVRKKDVNAALSELKNLKDNNPEIDVALITDRGGTLWINYPVYPETHGQNFAYLDWYQGVSKNWKPYLSTVFKRIVAEQDLAVATVTPVFDEKEAVIGVLIAFQRIVFLGQIIEEAIPDLLTSVTLIDQAGSIIYSNKSAVKDEIVRYSVPFVLTRAIESEKGDEEIASSDGSDKTYLSFAPVRGTGWTVIAGKERSAIVKAGHDGLIQRINIALLLFLFITLLFFFFRKVYLYQDKLNEAHRLYYDLYENAPDMHFSISAKMGAVRECNKMFLRKTGFTREEVIGRPIFELYHQESREYAEKGFRQFDQTDEIHDVERKVIRKDGSIMDVSLSVSAVRDKEGKIIYSRSTWRDITDRKKYEEMISNLSITDQLTGLYNRRGFMTLAEQQLKVAERTKNGLILFFADLDDLKGINDKSGHQAGDEALLETAHVLKEVFRKMDIIARVGGDEFAVLAPDASLEYAYLIRNRLQDQLEVHNALKNRDFTLSLSMGVVYHDPAHPASLDKLMAHADSLMYKEKDGKR